MWQADWGGAQSGAGSLQCGQAQGVRGACRLNQHWQRWGAYVQDCKVWVKLVASGLGARKQAGAGGRRQHVLWMAMPSSFLEDVGCWLAKGAQGGVGVGGLWTHRTAAGSRTFCASSGGSATHST